jgi:hypothetical protein
LAAGETVDAEASARIRHRAAIGALGLDARAREGLSSRSVDDDSGNGLLCGQRAGKRGERGNERGSPEQDR